MRVIFFAIFFSVIANLATANLQIDTTFYRSNHLDSLESLLTQDTNPTAKRVDQLNLLGRLYSDRDTEKAKSILHQSLSLADSLHYQWGYAQAAKLLGIIHDFQGYIAVSATYFQRASAILKKDTSQTFLAEQLFIESYPAGRVILGPLTKQFVLPRDSSITYLLKCIAIKRRLNDRIGAGDAYERLAHEYWDRAINEHTSKDYLRATEAWQNSLEEYKKAKFQDGIALATGKSGVGIYYLGDSLSALTLFRRGYKLSQLLGNKLLMAKNLTNLGFMSISWRKMDSAKYFFRSAVDLATELQAVDVIHGGYIELSKLYEAEGDYKMVSECYYKLFKSRDLHFSQANLLTTVEMQAQYENQIKNDKIKRLELENKLKEDDLKRRTIILVFVISIALMVAAGSYAFLMSRRRYLARLSAIETSHRIKNEKDRISKELHDNIGTRLTTLALSLRDLERRSSISHPVMELLRNDLQTVIAELRDSIWAINENEISLQEFSDKVRNLFWRFQQDNLSLNCKVSLHTDHQQVRIKPQVAINLFRILQEATSNSIKHSGASELCVDISYDHPTLLAIKVSDNGRGIDLQENQPNGSHYGLQNMRSRATEIGASLDIGSSNGTTIQVQINLQNKN